MKDHQLGFIPAESLPGFGPWSTSLRLQAECAASYEADFPGLPRHIEHFNKSSFLNPDKTYTPTPRQLAEFLALKLDREQRHAQTQRELEACKAQVMAERGMGQRSPEFYELRMLEAHARQKLKRHAAALPDPSSPSFFSGFINSQPGAQERLNFARPPV